MKLTGGEAVVRMLKEHGVEYAFGMGGFQPLPYYDALARQDAVKHVLIRDEKHGAFAADGYARVANHAAVADATLGPGATNLVSGLAESYGASIPMIALTGEVNSGISHRGATQESDQVGILAPTAKQTVQINRIERIPELVRRAFSVAHVGRPGPVHLNIPEDVFHGEHDFAERDLHAAPGSQRASVLRVRPDAAAIGRAVDLVRGAAAPVLLVGGGIHISEAYDALARFVDLTGIPVASTISGKGSIVETDPLSIGLCGRYSRVANELIAGADVLIVVGCKLGEIATNRWTLLSPDTKIVHIDIDPAELGHVYTPAVSLWGDARVTLDDLADAMEPDRARFKAARAERIAMLDARRAAWLATAQPSYDSPEAPVHVARLLRDLRAAAPAESILVADGGFAAHWSALLYDVHATGRTYIANRGHAAIGYGLPGAIGAKLAAPQAPVIALCGDNGFAMAIAELETAKRIGAPVLCVMVNNGALGYVKALQHALYDDRFISVEFDEVDYVGVARGFGCEGRRVDTPDQLAGALAEGLEAQQTIPFVIDVRTTTDAAKMLPGVDSRTVKRS